MDYSLDGPLLHVQQFIGNPKWPPP